MTQLVLSTWVFEIDLPVSIRSTRSFSNFCFCRSLVLLLTRWVLALICSSSDFASSSERVDLMLRYLDLASFFASALALIVSRILSLRKLTLNEKNKIFEIRGTLQLYERIRWFFFKQKIEILQENISGGCSTRIFDLLNDRIIPFFNPYILLRNHFM